VRAAEMYAFSGVQQAEVSAAVKRYYARGGAQRRCAASQSLDLARQAARDIWQASRCMWKRCKREAAVQATLCALQVSVQSDKSAQREGFFLRPRHGGISACSAEARRG